MCIPCVRVSLNPMTGVIICSAPRNVVLGAYKCELLLLLLLFVI